MAFGIKKAELKAWKVKVARGEIAFLTHYWQDPRFPAATTVTKVGCNDIEKLAAWGAKYGLKKEWIDFKERYPHYDLIGDKQAKIVRLEHLDEHIERFNL